MTKSRAKKKQRRRTAGQTARASARAATGHAEPPRATPRHPAPDPPTPRQSRFEVRDGVPRPQPIWAPFPLTEIGMAAGLAIFVAGALSDGRRANWLLSVAVAMLVVVVGELCLREHFGGFRSHTLLLAVLPVAILNGAAVLALGDAVRGPPVLALDVALAGGLAWVLNRHFRAAHDRAAWIAKV